MRLNGLEAFMYDCRAKNNEEYKEALKKRMRALLVLLVLGVITLATMILLIYLKPEMLDSYEAGLLTGLGTGLFFGGIVAILQLKKRMKSEESLKQARLAETDEREREISNISMRMTSKIMLAALYLVMLFSLFVSREIALMMCGLIMLYVVSYTVCRKIISKRM